MRSEGRRLVPCFLEPVGQAVVVEVHRHGRCLRVSEPASTLFLLLDLAKIYEGQGGGRRPPRETAPSSSCWGAAYAARLRRLLAPFVFALSAPYGGPFFAYRLALRRWLLTPAAVALEGM